MIRYDTLINIIYTYQRSHENISSRHTFMCYTFIAFLPLPIIHTNDPISDQGQKRLDFFIRKYKNTNFCQYTVCTQAYMHACGKKIIKESGAGFLCVSFFADFIFRTKPDFLSLPTKVYLLGLLDTWRCIFCNRKVGKKEQQDLANMYTDRLTWRTVVVFGNAVNESFFCEKKHTFQHATFGASCCSSTLPA